MQDSPDAKKPCKGILKTSSSFDRPGASYRKSAKFDELNVLQTYHPIDKDYGHMRIEEPKTPFNYDQSDPEQPDELDADLLAEKLRIAANTQTPSFGADECSDDDFPETAEEKVRRIEFERRRKAHYNEFEAVRLARKLIEEELEPDEEDEVTLLSESNVSTKATDSEFGVSEDSFRDAEAGAEAGEEEATSQKSERLANAERTSATYDRPMDVDQQIDPRPCAGRQH